MSFLSKYKTDKDAELNGVWVEIDQDTEIKVARLSNERARELRRKLEKPYRNFPQVPDSVSEEILRKVMAQAVLLGWQTRQKDGSYKPVLTTDGDAIEYSPAAAEKLFKDFPDFLNDVVSLAVARETFQAEAVEAAKND